MSALFMYFKLRNNYQRQKSVKSPKAQNDNFMLERRKKLFVAFISILEVIIASLSFEIDEMKYSISLLNNDSWKFV